MPTPDPAGAPLEAKLSMAVEMALARVIAKTTGASMEEMNGYKALKAPILGKLVGMQNGQAFEITFNAPEVAAAFAEGFNAAAPKTQEYIYGAIPEGPVLSLKRMAPIGFVIQDGKQTPM